jgi:hypothetical protein
MGTAGADSKPTPVLPILIAMVLGAIVGKAVGPDGLIGGIHLLPLFDTVGTMFINLLKMLIVPLILASVITGVASLGTGPDLGRLGGKTLSFYVITTLLAVLIALTLVNVIEPGVRDGQPVKDALALTADAGEVTAGVMHRAETSVLDSIKGIVPANMVDAALNTKMIGLVLFSILFGFFLARIAEPHRGTVLGFWQGIFLIMMRMTGFVMMLAPIGVFALIAKVVAISGFEAGWPLVLFALCVVGGPRVVRLRRAAGAAHAGRAREPVAAVPRHGAGAAHGILHRVLVGDPAVVPGMPGAARQGVAAYRRVRDAARRVDESRRQRVIRMRGGDVHRAGLRIAPVVRHAVHRRDPRAGDVDGHGGNSGGLAGGHRGDPRRGRPAGRGHRRAAGLRPAARHVPYRHQCACRCGLRGDRRAARRRDRGAFRARQGSWLTFARFLREAHPTVLKPAST